MRTRLLSTILVASLMAPPVLAQTSQNGSHTTSAPSAGGDTASSNMASGNSSRSPAQIEQNRRQD